jgi:endonuclease/exonuclease/phosphatase (EEP) superfamily protein YafD
MKITTIIFCLLVLNACQQNTVPQGILSLAQMTPLVEEITLLETHYQSRYGVPSQYKEALDISVKSIFKKTRCSKATFEKSLKYYAAHPELQKELNEQLLTELSRKLH